EQLLRDPSYREEHAIVARRIERTLRAHAIWVAAAPEPELVRIANIQHLATPIRAQLAAPLDALELAGAMHPTPAVGGEPLAATAALVPAAEGLEPRRAAGAGGSRPRLVRGAGGVDRRQRRRRALRGAAVRAAARRRGPLLRRKRHRARLRPGPRARRDGGQAAGAAPAARSLSARETASQRRSCSRTLASRPVRTSTIAEPSCTSALSSAARKSARSPGRSWRRP